MVKTIDILGIEVNNSSVRDMMHMVEEYMDEPAMNTIETITASMLLDCQNNPFMQEVLNGLDLPVIGEVEILSAAGIDATSKRQEINSHEFFHEFMKYMVRSHKSIFMLGEDQQELDELTTYVNEEYGKVKIVGSHVVVADREDLDGAINELNGTTPDVIISLLDSPFQEEFLQKERLKLNASLWFGIGKNYARKNRFGPIGRFARHLIYRGKLMRSISEYDEEVGQVHEKPSKTD